MGSANIPEGMVKKETMIIAALVALIVGFLGGVIFSSFRVPPQSTTAVQGQAQQQQSGGQPQTGPTQEQAAKIFSLEQEVKANPRNVNAWTQLGNLLYDTNQPALAVNAYKKSLELNQAQPHVWTDMGVMYRSLRQYKEALAAFEKAVALEPTLEPAVFNKGIVLMDMGDKAGAIQAWQQVLVINPNARTPNGQPVKDFIDSVK